MLFLVCQTYRCFDVSKNVLVREANGRLYSLFWVSLFILLFLLLWLIHANSQHISNMLRSQVKKKTVYGCLKIYKTFVSFFFSFWFDSNTKTSLKFDFYFLFIFQKYSNHYVASNKLFKKTATNIKEKKELVSIRICANTKKM